MGSATTVFKSPSLNSLFKNDFSRSLNSRFHHSYSKIIFVVNSPIYQTATVLSFTSISLDLLLLACRKKNIFFSSQWTTQSLGYHQSVPPTSSRFIKIQSQPCKETSKLYCSSPARATEVQVGQHSYYEFLIELETIFLMK